jgi:hypothetical protein
MQLKSDNAESEMRSSLYAAEEDVYALEFLYIHVREHAGRHNSTCLRKEKREEDKSTVRLPLYPIESRVGSSLLF